MTRSICRFTLSSIFLVVGLQLAIGGYPAVAADPAAKRPNIFWIIAEDFGVELGCYGTPQVFTPNLDRLAADGVRYAKAFTTAPVCSASRSAFCTGMYQTRIGAHNHRSHRDDGYQLPPGVRPVTDWMRDAGYFSANLVQLPPQLGFRGQGKIDWNFTHAKRPYDSNAWADLKSHQPFYAQLNLFETHRDFKAPLKADPAKVVIPPYYPDHPVTRADWAAYLDSASELDRKVGVVLEQLAADGLADDTIVMFFGDHGQSHVRGKQWCYDSGLHIPLIIRWPKNFAVPRHFTPGSVDERLIAAIDFLPTMLALAGAPKPEKMEGEIFLGDRADPPREYVFGARDRCDETAMRIRTVRDVRYRYIRNFTPERPFLSPNHYKETSYPVWNLLKQLHAEGKLTPAQEALCAPRLPDEELYDLENDPYEIQNLAHVYEHHPSLVRLRGALESWLARTNDQGRIPEPAEVVERQGVTRPGGKPNQSAGAADGVNGVEKLAEKGSATSPARPNILFCFADDWGRYASAYAALERRPTPNQVVKTPNIDRVAGRGVLFRNAFVNAPSCTPCRSALLSGQYFFRTGRGAILQGAQWDPAIPSYPLLLKEAGYHIGETYKVWSPGTPDDAPYGAGKYRYEKAGIAFNNFSENATAAVERGTPLADSKVSLLKNVSENFAAFMADRPAGQPFCYWFGPTNVHRKWVKGSGKALWGIDPDALKGKLPPFLPDVPEVREDFADYLGEIQAFDAAVGILLDRLTASGELERTVVVISGDHGPPGFTNGKCNLYDFGVGVALVAMGPGIAGGRVVDDFVNLMDLAPTFLELGGVAAPEVMTGSSLVGVLRSSQAGLVDPQRTWVVTGRERHVAAAREGNLPYPQRALRTQDFLYIRNFAPDRWPLGGPNEVSAEQAPDATQLENDTFCAFADMDASPTKAWLVAHRAEPEWKRYYDMAFGKRPGEELYDLRRDPDQVNNVAAEPAYASRKEELAGRLLGVLRGAQDPRVSGDGQAFERAPFTDAEPAKPKKKPRG